MVKLLVLIEETRSRLDEALASHSTSDLSELETRHGASAQADRISPLLSSFDLPKGQKHLTPFQKSRLENLAHPDTEVTPADRGELFSQVPVANFGDPFRIQRNPSCKSWPLVLVDSLEDFASGDLRVNSDRALPILLSSRSLRHPLAWRLFLEDQTLLVGLDLRRLKALLQTRTGENGTLTRSGIGLQLQGQMLTRPESPDTVQIFEKII
jgi:hypothetical protein